MTDPNAQTPYEPPPGQPYQQAPYQQAAPAGPAAALTQAEDKQWAMFAHFGGILWLLPSLIIYLVFKERGPFTRQESKEALNWQITWIPIWIVSQIIGAIMFVTPLWPISFVFTLLIPWLLYIANIVFSIMGGIKVNNGQAYRYPVAVRLIK